MPRVLETPSESDTDPYFGVGLGGYNQLQIELAQRAGGGSKEKERKWFDLNSGKTGRFRTLLSSRPDIVELVKTNRKLAIEEIEKLLSSLD